MAKRTIIFRADGGPSIGMGHFTRTLALAEMLNENFHCIFATRTPTDYQIAEIEKVCHGRFDLPEDDSHFNHFLEYLNGDEIVVLDNYYYTTDYQKAIKAKGCKLVCIDDLHDKHFVADVVINHAEGICADSYSVEDYTQLLLGFRYALIKGVFRMPVDQPVTKEYSCLIMMGGADPFNLTSKILNHISHTNFKEPVAIISGADLPKDSFANKSFRIFIFNQLTAYEVADVMRKSYFGIFPASTVAIEACAVRLPFICGYFVDNQKEMYDGIEKNKLAICIGNLNTLQEKQFNEALKKIDSKIGHESIIKRQALFMDNQSEKRLLQIFQKL